MRRLFLLVAFASSISACAQNAGVITGADQLDLLLDKLKGLRVGLLVNHTAVIGKTHLADTLKARGINLVKIFAPEHGFRGNEDAGARFNDLTDPKTGALIVSLYGKNLKATPEQMSDIDIVVFDIQDVGVRFFTYAGSMHYMMEACAENGKKLLILDRPNPNGDYIDGPILQTEQRSFVGMHPVPIVHGLTLGELAKMINGEGWLKGKNKCDLEIIPMKNWKHSDSYSIKLPPSPNLPNDHAIALYSSTCFFEGTALSVGRGTLHPFEYIGHPELKDQPFSFTPVSIEGMAKKPRLENQVCYGLDLTREKPEKKIMLRYVIAMYKAFPDKEKFFINYFTTLAGTPALKQQIIDGMTEDQIRESWKKDLEAYKNMRKKYLIYQ